MKKYKIFILISICTLMLIAGGTYAWYIWKSETKAIVNINVCTPRVHFSGGATINAKNIVPVMDKNDGLKKEINVYLNKGCDSTALMNLYMNLDTLGSGLQHETFVYELYKGDELITSGNFADKKEGDIVELARNEVINENLSIYILYIYIDGTKSNPKTMQNQTFSFSIYSEGTGAIYKENVIANYSVPTSANSEFLNTGLIRKDIQSVTITEDNTVPEGVLGSKDISSKGDGSVMMWYTDTDNNNLYEVYIGGDSGPVKANTNGQGMFAYLTNVQSLDLSNLDTSNVTTMTQMFRGSSSLKEINLSSFDTSNVTSMFTMFSGCSSLTSLDLSSFNTENVTNMQSMFFNCSSLTSLDLSSFNTENVTNMRQMFQSCSSLTSLDLSSFNTENVTNMQQMFQDCSSLTSLDLSSFNTENVTNMQQMFQDCLSLTSLDLSSFNTPKVTNIRAMFSGSLYLMVLDLRNFNFSNVESLYYYTDTFKNVSLNVVIYVKDDVQKELFNTKWNKYTNVLVTS